MIIFEVKDGDRTIRGGCLPKQEFAIMRFKSPITHETYLKAFGETNCVGIDTMYYSNVLYVTEARVTNFNPNRKFVKVLGRVNI